MTSEIFSSTQKNDLNRTFTYTDQRTKQSLKCDDHIKTIKTEHLIQAKFVTLIVWLIAIYLFGVVMLYEFKSRSKASRKLVSAFLIGIITSTVVNWSTQMLELWMCCFFSCSTYRWMNASSYILNTFFFYSLVWHYQHQLYLDPRLPESKSKQLKIVNIIFILAIYVTYLIVMLFYVSNYNLCKTDYGCISIWNDKSVEVVVIPVTIASLISTWFFRIGLFLLITYPFVHRLTEVDKGKNILTIKKELDPDIRSLFIRLGVCTLTSLITHVVIDCVILLNAMNFIKIHTSNWYGFELISNPIVINCLFVNWKQRLFPFIKCD